METIRKQASKLRDQVAKQQQAVFKQFSGRFGHDSLIVDEAEISCHQKLQMLYNSTKGAKHFQRDIARGIESFISVSSKQIEIITKLAEDCCKYSSEFQSYGFALARASLDFGTSHVLMEKERKALLRILGEQVFEPLRTMIMGAPLEDARHLTYRYERIRQDVETQTAEVMRRQLKANDVNASSDSIVKLQHAESKLSDLKTALSALGREATAAMVSVEAQQQQITYEKLLAMVEAERSYHHHVADILDKLHDKMVSMKTPTEQSSQPTAIVPKTGAQTANEDIPVQRANDDIAAQTVNRDITAPTANKDIIAQTAKGEIKFNSPENLPANGHGTHYFIAEAIHPFDAQADGELNLSVGDYVVVRQVAQNGWSEGECKGKAGWFPSAYIERRDKAPASKVIEARLLS